MASPVKVKTEPVGDVFCVDTDSEAEDDIDVEKLQPLAPKFALLSKYPVGCKVWYNLRLSPETKQMQAKSARVEEVSIHFENLRRVYKVKSEVMSKNNMSFYEDQLVFAISCPVTVTKMDTDGALDGIIVYLERKKGIDGRWQVTYTIQYSVEDDITIEPGVAADRIKYRTNHCGVGADGKECNSSSVKQKQTTCTQEGDTDKEEKEAEVSSHSSSAESFAHTENSSRSDCNPSTSLDTTRWESPSPPQRKRSSRPSSIVNHRATKVAKREVRNEARVEVERDTNTNKRKIGNSAAAVLILTIPSWWMNQWGKENRRQLHSHLIGKTKSIKSSTNCSIQVSGHDTNDKMRITIKSLSRDPDSKLNSIRYANRLVEKSLVEYLACENSEKRLLYDLAVTAIDSCQLIQLDINSGLLQKDVAGSRAKQWWRLFELPCGQGMHSHDLSFLEALKVPKGIDCKIEVFKRSVKVPLASPYVLVSGRENLDVKNAALMVADAVRRHQRFCTCRPKW